MSAEGRHLVIDGFRLHMLDWGGDGPALLLLHGGALTAHTWDPVCQSLRDRYRCLALDQRGHGDSEWSPELDYSIDAYVRDLAGLVESLDLQQLVVVGQSLGAVNALTYSARHPDKVAGLVMIDAGPWVQREGAGRIADFVLADPVLPSVEDFVERAHRFNPRRDPEQLRATLVHNLRPLPGGSWTWKYDRRHLTHERFDAFRQELIALQDRLADVRCPVLVVRGEESDVFSAVDAERLAAALPDARVITVPDAGHTVQGDNPRALARALDEFAAETLT
jgi:esterase